jgi:hypothetical protein
MSYILNTSLSHSQASDLSDSMERPPAYNASDDEPEGFVQQTTTTITTTTTTSFFPGLRRRINKSAHVEAATGSSETAPEILQVSHQVQETEISNGLLIHKELPQLPGHRIRARTRKGRPRTADAVEADRKDSAVGVTMPFALAHAAMGLNVPPMTPGWSLAQFSGDEHSAALQDPYKFAKGRLSLSLGTNEQLTEGVDPITSNPVHVGQDASTRTGGKSVDISTGSARHYFPSVIPHAAPRKSKTMQHGIADAGLGGSGKQITRRASWWIRRKPELPLDTARSSISSGTAADLSRVSGTTGPPVVDLSYSPPPDALFHAPASPLAITSQPNSPVQMHSRASHESGANISLLTHAAPRSSSRRPRSLSLFLKPSSPFSPEFDHSANGQLSPTSPVHHARQRTGQTPPLLRRLSSHFFSHSPYSSASATPQSSLSISGTFQTKASEEQAAPVVIPRPKIDEESPEGYVQRLMEAVTKAEIAMVLASRWEHLAIVRLVQTLTSLIVVMISTQKHSKFISRGFHSREIRLTLL